MTGGLATVSGGGGGSGQFFSTGGGNRGKGWPIPTNLGLTLKPSNTGVLIDINEEWMTTKKYLSMDAD